MQTAKKVQCFLARQMVHFEERHFQTDPLPLHKKIEPPSPRVYEIGDCPLIPKASFMVGKKWMFRSGIRSKHSNHRNQKPLRLLARRENDRRLYFTEKYGAPRMYVLGLVHVCRVYSSEPRSRTTT